VEGGLMKDKAVHIYVAFTAATFVCVFNRKILFSAHSFAF
jgi:hypothetical protein